MPKRNREFWLSKFEANKKRDARALLALEAQGIAHKVIWECEAEDAENLRALLEDFFVAMRG